MIKIIMLLVYILDGQLMVEQKPFDTKEDCHLAAGQRVDMLNNNPKMEAGLLALCVPSRMAEAKAKPRG